MISLLFSAIALAEQVFEVDGQVGGHVVFLMLQAIFIHILSSTHVLAVQVFPYL